MKDKIRCIIVDDERVARDILEQHLSRIDRIELVAGCKNVAEAFNVLHHEKVDLVFLDINLPEVSGLSFARSVNQGVKIIFTTAYREFALDGFDLQAVDYLLKPVSFERLMQSVSKYFKEQVPQRPADSDRPAPEEADHVFVRSDRKMIRVNFADILYLESLSDYVRIRLENKTVVTRETLAHFEALLPAGSFLRIHRSFIVAAKRIESFTPEEVEIAGRNLPVSRRYRHLVTNRLK